MYFIGPLEDCRIMRRRCPPQSSTRERCKEHWNILVSIFIHQPSTLGFNRETGRSGVESISRRSEPIHLTYQLGSKTDELKYSHERGSLQADRPCHWQIILFKSGNEVFRQRTGIPMGIDPVSQMSNLYSYGYEARFMERLTKENYGAAKKKFTRTSQQDSSTIS